MFDLRAELDAAVEMGRDAAEARMTDSCTISRLVGVATDPVTGEVAEAFSPVYSGKCRYKKGERVASTDEAGGRVFATVAPEVHIPIGAADVRPGDRVECDAAAYDPLLGSRVAVVTAFAAGSQQTAFRIPLASTEAVS